jgi:hypothetical protein
MENLKLKPWIYIQVIRSSSLRGTSGYYSRQFLEREPNYVKPRYWWSHQLLGSLTLGYHWRPSKMRETNHINSSLTYLRIKDNNWTKVLGVKPFHLEVVR